MLLQTSLLTDNFSLPGGRAEKLVRGLRRMAGRGTGVKGVRLNFSWFFGSFLIKQKWTRRQVGNTEIQWLVERGPTVTNKAYTI